MSSNKICKFGPECRYPPGVCKFQHPEKFQQAFETDFKVYEAVEDANKLAGVILDALIVMQSSAPDTVKMQRHAFISEMLHRMVLTMWAKMVITSPNSWWTSVGIRNVASEHANIAYYWALYFYKPELSIEEIVKLVEENHQYEENIVYNQLMNEVLDVESDEE